MTLLDALGWAGSALLIFSIVQTRILRLRVLNLQATLMLLAFNVGIRVWPMVAMNAALAAINVWFIIKLRRERHSTSAFEVLDVPASDTYLGHETAGVVVVRDRGDGVAHVELDYVTPQFRDFSPGEFVYRESDLFRRRGFRAIVTPQGMVAPYYQRLGFRQDGDVWRLDLSAP